MRVHFVNENVGGHATMHLAIRRALAGRTDVEATFFDVPPPTGVRRLLGARVPGLDRFDADLQALRIQIAASTVVRRHLASGPPADVLHLYTHNVGLLSPAVLRSRPSVVSLDATNVQNAYRLPQRRPGALTPHALRPTLALERAVYEAATLVAAQSEWAASSLRNDYDVPDAKIRVIPFGITVPPRPSRPATSAPVPRITFIGRSMDRKGGWRLLDVWQRHLRDRSRLTLVTLDPVPSVPGLEVRNDIRPGDGRLEAVLAETDVFAFPTDLDTFGYAAIEAMAAAVPVVATDTAALPEVVKHGLTGLLVATGDDRALAAALAELLDEPTRRRRMGHAGRQRVEERFDASVTTDTLIGVLAEAVAARTG
ncbi:MAG TPA: glycosyltransferase family 4 protein [Acidimicrobiales bacterium]|nr:glycosyltransferase family 4 protein [Acidimicrobiales bacterium]